jgi:hypothetical protein
MKMARRLVIALLGCLCSLARQHNPLPLPHFSVMQVTASVSYPRFRTNRRLPF